MRNESHIFMFNIFSLLLLLFVQASFVLCTIILELFNLLWRRYLMLVCPIVAIFFASSSSILHKVRLWFIWAPLCIILLYLLS